LRVEFDLIAQIRRQVAAAHGDGSVRLGIGDDAAVVAPTPGHDLVVCTDSIVVDRHFHADWPAADIGYLALAVNLSDLAAMAARPRWLVLALTLPVADSDWLQQCLQGMLDLASEHHCQLIGGNLARGPMNLTVTVIGEVATGQAVQRIGAQPGDQLLVTGTLGDCAAAVALGDAADPYLQQRWRLPVPRVAIGQALQAYATAMIDVSDGLLADLAHLLGDTMGADLNSDRLPSSDALLAAVPDPQARQHLQRVGGSDYELLLSVPSNQVAAAQAAAAALDTRLTVIGEVTSEPGIRPPYDASGWDHFSEHSN
jgi:thiamine-monophosphate kinase